MTPSLRARPCQGHRLIGRVLSDHSPTLFVNLEGKVNNEDTSDDGDAIYSDATRLDYLFIRMSDTQNSELETTQHGTATQKYEQPTVSAPAPTSNPVSLQPLTELYSLQLPDMSHSHYCAGGTSMSDTFLSTPNSMDIVWKDTG
ncbi:hypothetical protein J6590_036290 [Homalodisca vitripennis]|nr:hypothetical protein J6590_036290 [Homalodisca vitripennis]